MSTMPASPSVADAVAESRRLLEEAQDYNRYYNRRDAARASAQMATGHVLLAIGEELATVRAELSHLAGIRREVADLGQAVRELTATLTKAADPVAEAARALPDIANAISDVPDHGEVLGDIATAVESLVSSLDEQPRRRSWFGRRSSKDGAR